MFGWSEPSGPHLGTTISRLPRHTPQRTLEEMMAVNWNKDIDQALNEAKQQNRPILLDFSAAPA